MAARFAAEETHADDMEDLLGAQVQWALSR
ncbi:hypothetical protein LMG28688_06802 [Paraburkholderia caffeinitolerans]|uniref:Uncharacterized protein n=1 Tax=Paraburkholderia caffeinitolerans TaxID=1723730 RepID=A0A6J5H0X0_9BURK|nr:hypothetical protein LMG28688_06802 [Paraburkholderia caffeinitolerans]